MANPRAVMTYIVLLGAGTGMSAGRYFDPWVTSLAALASATAFGVAGLLLMRRIEELRYARAQ